MSAQKTPDVRVDECCLGVAYMILPFPIISHFCSEFLEAPKHILCICVQVACYYVFCSYQCLAYSRCSINGMVFPGPTVLATSAQTTLWMLQLGLTLRVRMSRSINDACCGITGWDEVSSPGLTLQAGWVGYQAVSSVAPCGCLQTVLEAFAFHSSFQRFSIRVAVSPTTSR